MKRVAFILLSLTITQLVLAQNTVCFTVSTNPNPSDPAIGGLTKYVDVYGCSIYAESTIPDAKVLHAAAVWAELIDNDEDGIVDDPALLTQLQNSQAIMPIFQTDGNAASNAFFNNYNGNGAAAVLWDNEIDPSNTGNWGYDASVEEIIHTINAVGHASIYPLAFNTQANSSLLATAMDSARGGQWIAHPSNYPANAWYHYDDNTCDYECMAIEYLYWMIVSNMEILNNPSTCAGIADEWEPCSQVLLQSTDVLGYALITNPNYKLPQNAPDGNYCPTSLGVENMNLSSFKMYPNPANKLVTINRNEDTSSILNLRNTLGQEIISKVISEKTITLDLSGLVNGVYFISIGSTINKLTIN